MEERSSTTTRTKDNSPYIVRLFTESSIAIISALSVAPLIAIVDRAVVSNASGLQPLGPGLINGFKTLATNPGSFVKQPTFLLVWGVYSCTYIAANNIEAICDRYETSSVLPKFIGSAFANVSSNVSKDRLLAKMFSNPINETLKPVRITSLGCFATCDSMTVLSSFILPNILSKYMQDRFDFNKGKSDVISQILAPVSMQFFNTPFNLLGYDIYNRESANLYERKQFIQKQYIKTVCSRVTRAFFAFGIGGMINKSLRKEAVTIMNENFDTYNYSYPNYSFDGITLVL